MSGYYFNLTPEGSRLFFGEVFAIACVMLLDDDCCVYFKYSDATIQRQVRNFFSNILENNGSGRIFEEKLPSNKEKVAINNSHEIAFEKITKDGNTRCFDFSKSFIKGFPFKYQRLINNLLRIKLRNTDLFYPGKGKAVFLSIRNRTSDKHKNITKTEFDKMCVALDKQNVRTVVVIGDELPSDITLDNSSKKHKMSFVDFTTYDQIILSNTIIPEELLFQAQVYFLKQLKEKYQVTLAVGGSSGGSHMLGSLGIPIVFSDLCGTRFEKIKYPKNIKSTFFPFKDEKIKSKNTENELENQIKEAYILSLKKR